MCSSILYYQTLNQCDDESIDCLIKLSEKNYKWGFWVMFGRLRKKSKTWSHKSVYRVSSEMKLALRSKRKRPIPKREKKRYYKPLLQICIGQWTS